MHELSLHGHNIKFTLVTCHVFVCHWNESCGARRRLLVLSSTSVVVLSIPEHVYWLYWDVAIHLTAFSLVYLHCKLVASLMNRLVWYLVWFVSVCRHSGWKYLSMHCCCLGWTRRLSWASCSFTVYSRRYNLWSKCKHKGHHITPQNPARQEKDSNFWLSYWFVLHIAGKQAFNHEIEKYSKRRFPCTALHSSQNKVSESIQQSLIDLFLVLYIIPVLQHLLYPQWKWTVQQFVLRLSRLEHSLEQRWGASGLQPLHTSPDSFFLFSNCCLQTKSTVTSLESVYPTSPNYLWTGTTKGLSPPHICKTCSQTLKWVEWVF